MDFNRRNEEELTEKMNSLRETAFGVLEQTTLSKTMLTDSRGQHKLPKAKARLKAAELVPAEVVDDDEFTFDMY